MRRIEHPFVVSLVLTCLVIMGAIIWFLSTFTLVGPNYHSSTTVTLISYGCKVPTKGTGTIGVTTSVVFRWDDIAADKAGILGEAQRRAEEKAVICGALSNLCSNFKQEYLFEEEGRTRENLPGAIAREIEARGLKCLGVDSVEQLGFIYSEKILEAMLNLRFQPPWFYTRVKKQLEYQEKFRKENMI